MPLVETSTEIAVDMLRKNTATQPHATLRINKVMTLCSHNKT